MISVTPFYAGCLALLFLALSLNVVRGRRAYKVSVGDGGERDLTKRMRAQANCAEYAPIGLILLGLLEAQGLGWLWVNLFGMALLAGRVMHGYGFASTPQIVPLRIWGMYLTVGMICLSALLNIVMSLF